MNIIGALFAIINLAMLGMIFTSIKNSEMDLQDIALVGWVIDPVCALEDLSCFRGHPCAAMTAWMSALMVWFASIMWSCQMIGEGNTLVLLFAAVVIAGCIVSGTFFKGVLLAAGAIISMPYAETLTEMWINIAICLLLSALVFTGLRLILLAKPAKKSVVRRESNG